MESPPPDTQGPLDAAWAELEAHWNDAGAHKKFLALADTLDQLPDAGRRYRLVRESDPARAERAKQQVDALLVLAMSRMKAEKSPEPKARRRLDFIALGISAALVAAAFWSMLHGR